LIAKTMPEQGLIKFFWTFNPIFYNK